MASGGLCFDTELLPLLRKMTMGGDGPASVGPRLGGGGKELGWKWPKARKVTFFSFKSLFYFLFFQNPLLFHKKSLQIQNYL
jgi:hypothetical protein